MKKYIFWKVIYTSVNQHTKIKVEEICANLGVYRQYYKLDDAEFKETFTWHDDILRFKAFAYTSLGTPPTGVTISGNPQMLLNPYFFKTGIFSLTNTNDSSLYWPPDFNFPVSGTTNYFTIVAQYGTDAEEYFSDIPNNTMLMTNISGLYTNASAQISITTTYRLVKYNNHIYFCARSTSNSGVQFAANMRVYFGIDMIPSSNYLYSELD